MKLTSLRAHIPWAIFSLCVGTSISCSGGGDGLQTPVPPGPGVDSLPAPQVDTLFQAEPVGDPVVPQDSAAGEPAVTFDSWADSVLSNLSL